MDVRVYGVYVRGEGIKGELYICPCLRVMASMENEMFGNYDSIRLIDGTLEVFALLICVILLWALLSEKRDEGKVDGYLIVLFEMNIAMLGTAAVANFTEEIPENIWLIRWLLFATYVACNFNIVLFACYCTSVVERIMKTSKLVIYFTFASCSVGSAIWLAFIESREYIDMAADGSYKYGDYHWISLIFALMSLAAVFIFIISKMRYIGKRMSWVLMSYGILPLFSVPLMRIWDATPVYISMTLSLLLVYSMIHVEQAVQNIHNERIIANQARELSETKSRIMISQMQPHFMYNVLNSIYYLCEKDTESAQDAVNTFADYLRINMDAMGKADLVSFENELTHAQKYLALEKMRFDDDLEVEYDIKVRDFKLPVFSLQPLVENAVKHGICKKDGGGVVKISTDDDEDYYYTIIEDTGVGFDPEAAVKNDGRSHVGKESVTKRIDMMLNGRVEYISKIGEGTKVTLVIPKRGRDVKNEDFSC